MAKKWLATATSSCIVSPLKIMATKSIRFWIVLSIATIGLASGAFASEADIHIPDLTAVKFAGLGGISGEMLMYLGIVICAIGAVFGLVQYKQTKALPVHESMRRANSSPSSGR
jgi:hypothetical protein